jgi:phosphatidylserine decarboxylase
MLVAALAASLSAVAVGTALAWKWRLGVPRSLLALSVLGAVISAALVPLGSATSLPPAAVAALVFASILGIALAVLLYRFYRDPERVPPQRDGAILSPADGTVAYIREAQDGLLPVSTKDGKAYSLNDLTKAPLGLSRAVVVGIALNFLDVHVNRAPIGGVVTRYDYFPGAFGSLRRQEMLFENERATFVIERGSLRVAVVLIASRLVRRIVSYVAPGDRLALGQRIGFIRFGSQVDLVLPAERNLEILVRGGDRVVAGESIVAVVATSSSEHPSSEAPQSVSFRTSAERASG